MIILRLGGGLGNQMFQYSFGKALSLRYNQRLFLDHSLFQKSNRIYCLDLFQLKAHTTNELDFDDLHKYQKFKIQEDQFHFDEQAFNSLDGHELATSLFVISGYWQSFKYFQIVEAQIREDFTIKYFPKNEYADVQKAILNSNSVMVHVRRGDYLSDINLKSHRVVDVDYITKGMSYYRRRLRNPSFFVFSDDIDWCKLNIANDHDVFFVGETPENGKIAFTLMYSCKHFLISNSTFSWWAAWLAKFEKKNVICPKKWFGNNDNILDLILPSWVQI